MRISDWSSDVCSSDLVGAGGGRDAPDAAERAALDVGLDLLVADLAAQRLVVVALDAGAAGVGEQRLAGAVLLDVVLVGAADVADDVRHQRAIGIAPGQVGLQDRKSTRLNSSH